MVIEVGVVVMTVTAVTVTFRMRGLVWPCVALILVSCVNILSGFHVTFELIFMCLV